MKRREILKYTALMTGAAVGAPLMATILSGCKSEDTATDLYKPTFFKANEFSFIKEVIDVILPKTDSPAASEVGVHQMIDTMVGSVYKEEDQSDYKNGFTALLNYLVPTAEGKEQNLGSFSKLEADKKTALLQKLINSTDEALQDAKGGLLSLRQQTVAYYLSSEEIGKNHLNYLPVPGEYEACITLESVGGKAWAI